MFDVSCMFYIYFDENEIEFKEALNGKTIREPTKPTNKQIIEILRRFDMPTCFDFNLIVR